MRGRLPAAERPDSVIPIALVLAAICFNAVLALINGNVMKLNAQHVMLVEAVLVLGAQAYAIAHYNRHMTPWYAFIVLVGLFSIIRMAAIGEVELKYFRDFLLIQTFVVLGMASTARMAVRMMMIACAIVVAGIALEAISVDTFSKLFDVKDYYIATRGMDSGEFTYEDSDLYVSATRYQGRFIPFFGLHRMSSIFLEPVSLGNFVLIVVCFALAFWRDLTTRQRVFVCFSVILMIVASDGRQALATTGLILGMAVFTRIVVPNVAIFIMPLAILGSILLVGVLDLHSGADDMPGRLAYTVELIGKMQPIDYFGLSDRLVPEAADSGIVFMIITHSIVIFAVLWILTVVSLGGGTRARADYLNSIWLYLALAMLVSYSFVSIKTAAPLWFLYGVLAGPVTSTVRARPRAPLRPIARHEAA
jgi:putative polymerase